MSLERDIYNVVREGRGPGGIIGLEARLVASAGAGAFGVRGDEDKGKGNVEGQGEK